MGRTLCLAPSLLFLLCPLLAVVAQATPVGAGADPHRLAVTAALQVAADDAHCRAIEPFYWEIGDARQALVSGAEGAKAPVATTVMPVASATKWVFAAYVVQRRGGELAANELSTKDIEALTMQSGYTSHRHASCIRLLPARRASQTVGDCLQRGNNGQYTPQHRGHFFYNGGHFQHYAATTLGLAGDNNVALADEIRGGLGIPFTFSFGSPQPAGGMSTSASDYAGFLRALLRGDLRLGTRLGEYAVCAQPGACPQALHSPIPTDRHWQYALGHWVESDPATGDGAFSSPGAFGFYPWIDAGRRYYGILARHQLGKQSAFASVECGRRIRQAFLQAISANGRFL